MTTFLKCCKFIKHYNVFYNKFSRLFVIKLCIKQLHYERKNIMFRNQYKLFISPNDYLQFRLFYIHIYIYNINHKPNSVVLLSFR